MTTFTTSRPATATEISNFEKVEAIVKNLSDAEFINLCDAIADSLFDEIDETINEYAKALGVTPFTLIDWYTTDKY